jgi:hypothetical protein
VNPDFIIGGVLVAVGIVAILVRRPFVRLIHRGLRLFYGEPVADDSIRGRPVVRITVVGAFMIVCGGVLLVTAAMELL